MIRYMKIMTILLTISILTGCMGMGMRISRETVEPIIPKFTNKIQKINTDESIDKLLKEIIIDLSKQELNLKSVAVWKIKTKTAGINTEIIRQKTITRLVNLKQFNVVSRERLEELLKEQGLSLSGTIDNKNAIEIGKLIGVENFIDGHVFIENDKITLSFNLIETKTGIILWAKTVSNSI